MRAGGRKKPHVTTPCLHSVRLHPAKTAADPCPHLSDFWAHGQDRRGPRCNWDGSSPLMGCNKMGLLRMLLRSAQPEAPSAVRLPVHLSIPACPAFAGGSSLGLWRWRVCCAGLGQGPCPLPKGYGESNLELRPVRAEDAGWGCSACCKAWYSHGQVCCPWPPPWAAPMARGHAWPRHLKPVCLAPLLPPKNNIIIL